MTELDLGLKAGARRLLWGMGYSTRLDVELRGDRPPPGSQRRPTGRSRQNPTKVDKSDRPADVRGGGPETFTDLDVLGVLVAPGFHLSTTIADCKSGYRDKPTARMFWLRGVADLFGADQVMLVREHEVNDATRQLSSRLGITVLASPDLLVMQRLHGLQEGASEGALDLLFDRQAVAAYLSAFNGLDRRLSSLLEYRDFDYWVYEDYRNPIQLVAHLREAAKRLDPRNPIHLALFLDLAWLYTLSLVGVLGHIRGAFLRDPDRGIQEYLFGGPTNLIEKQETAALLRSVAPAGAPDLDHLPDYYGNLRELVTRLLRRPGEVQSALRYAEAASALMAARSRVSLPDVLGESFEPIAAKLVADVCGFLVAAAGLRPDFRGHARAWLLGEPFPDRRATAPSRKSRGRSEPVDDVSERAERPDKSATEQQGEGGGRQSVGSQPSHEIEEGGHVAPADGSLEAEESATTPSDTTQAGRTSQAHQDAEREQGVLDLDAEDAEP